MQWLARVLLGMFTFGYVRCCGVRLGRHGRASQGEVRLRVATCGRFGSLRWGLFRHCRRRLGSVENGEVGLGWALQA